MREIIFSSLYRQYQGTKLLTLMLEEEYTLLRGGQPDQVAGLEMSIQELVRQLVRERESMQKKLDRHGFSNLSDYSSKQSGEDQERLQQMLEQVIDQEQISARQSTINADLAMALWEQSGKLLSTFSERIAPKKRYTYTSKGTWNERNATAHLVSGRL